MKLVVKTLKAVMEGNSVIQGLPRINCFRSPKTYFQPSFYSICGQLVNDKLFWWLLCVLLRFYYLTTRIHRVWYLESAWLEKILFFLSHMLVNDPQVTVGNWTQRRNAPIENQGHATYFLHDGSHMMWTPKVKNVLNVLWLNLNHTAGTTVVR